MISPVFSVVIPAYNDGEYLAEAIDSALHQETSIPYEVIIVNDGSTDDTLSVIDAYGKQVRYLVKPNGGPGSARNTGVTAARSELILFLDVDDKALPCRFNRQARYMLEHPEVDVCFGNWIVEGERGNYLASYGLTSQSETFLPIESVLQRLLVRGSFVPTSTAAVRRHSYIAAGMQHISRRVCSLRTGAMPRTTRSGAVSRLKAGASLTVGVI
jgi:glycosyltransferase involved in cell wall biosynthesis